MRPERGRNSHDRLKLCLFGSQSSHHADENPDGIPALRAIVEFPVRTKWPERITPPQSISVHSNNHAHPTTVIIPRFAWSFGKGSQTLHVLCNQPKKNLIVSLLHERESHHAAHTTGSLA